MAVPTIVVWYQRIDIIDEVAFDGKLSWTGNNQVQRIFK